MDFCTLKNLLFSLKGEIEHCIERLELGLGLLRSESFVGPTRDGADDLKPKVVGRAPSIDNVVCLLGLDSSLVAISKRTSSILGLTLRVGPNSVPILRGF